MSNILINLAYKTPLARSSLKSVLVAFADGADPIVMLESAIRYAAYIKSSQSEERFVKHPQTFFGVGEHYLAVWLSPSSAAPLEERIKPVDHVLPFSNRLDEDDELEMPELREEERYTLLDMSEWVFNLDKIKSLAEAAWLDREWDKANV